MRHRLKFSQSSYVRMRGREQRGKKTERKRDLGQDAQRRGRGDRQSWRKTPGGKQRVRCIKGPPDTTPPQDGLLCGKAGALGARRPPALRLFLRGQQGSG